MGIFFITFTDSPTDANNLFCFTNFSAYFGPLKEAEKQWEEENKDYGKLYEIPAGKTFEIVDPYDSTRSSADVCFHSYLPTDGLCMYSESNGTAGGIIRLFIPLWYNQTQGYLVGYHEKDNNGTLGYELAILKWDADGNVWSYGSFDGDKSLYGF